MSKIIWDKFIAELLETELMDNYCYCCETLDIFNIFWFQRKHPIWYDLFMSFILLYLQEQRKIIFYVWIFIQFRVVFCSKIHYSSNMSFDDHIFYCFIVWNSFNFFIDQNSQLERFISTHILTVLICVW